MVSLQAAGRFINVCQARAVNPFVRNVVQTQAQRNHYEPDSSTADVYPGIIEECRWQLAATVQYLDPGNSTRHYITAACHVIS